MSASINADGFTGKSANRLYKESGSKLPFKTWLQDMQSHGHLNAAGTLSYTVVGGVGSGGDVLDSYGNVIGQDNQDGTTYQTLHTASAPYGVSTPYSALKVPVISTASPAATKFNNFLSELTQIAGVANTAVNDVKGAKAGAKLPTGKGASDTNDSALASIDANLNITKGGFLGVPNGVWFAVVAIGAISAGYYFYTKGDSSSPTLATK